MKKIFSILMAVFLLGGMLPAASYARQIVDSGECGTGVSWTLDEDGLLTLTGSGKMDDYNLELNSFGAPWATSAVNASRVTDLVVENGVSSIGSEAFRGCKNLKSVRLPQSVLSIGIRAFSGCSSLENLVIGEGVTKIGEYAFFGCVALNTLTIPDSVTQIGPSAFHGCAGLAELQFGSGLTSIGDSVFCGCTGLQSIVIPEGITTISSYAFYGCLGLMDVVLPDSLVYIGSKAFDNCGKLHFLCNKNSAALQYAEENGVAYGLQDGGDEENIISGNYNGMEWRIDRKSCVLTLTVNGEMPSFLSAGAVPWTQDVNKNYVHTAIIMPGAATVGNLAFYGCNALTQAVVPASVISIGSAAFYGCESLTEVDLPDSVSYIGPYAFHGCTALSDVYFGSGVKAIGASAFSGCTALSSVVIPNNVTTISDFLFKDCVRLTGIMIPGSVTSVGAEAFAGSGLSEVVLPAAVRTVQSRAFAGCASLYSVTFYSTKCAFGTDVIPQDAIICGYRNSDANAYADANELVFIEIGGTHEHEFVVVKTVPATCGRTGLNTLACSCGAKKLEVLPLTDLHVQGTVERTVITPATCVTAGEERITVCCTVCEKKLLENTYEIPPTGAHTPGATEKTIVVAPTCAAGKMAVTISCTVCGLKLLDETYVIPPISNHTPGEEVESESKPATCVEMGRKCHSVTCSVCGETVWETYEDIPALPHMDENNDRICDVCGRSVGDPCKFCGQVHENASFGRAQQMIHSILYFFLHTFGK